MKNQNKIEVYTVSYCPYCRKAKEYFKNNGYSFIEYPCDDNEYKHREELTEKFNLKSLATFPQIIINDVYVGGYSDFVDKLNRGSIVL